MTEPLIAVVGATGRVGTQLTALLVERGCRVRALGRDTKRLSLLGATETAQGSSDDRMYLAKALQGADAVYAMLPTNLASGDPLAQARRMTDALVAAIAEAKPKVVVALSAIGAHLEAGTGIIQVLHGFEARLRELPCPVVVLRSASFFENSLALIPLIRQHRLYGSPLKAELVLPMIATRDIASVAAERLMSAPPTPGVACRELHGAKDYEQRALATTLGGAIGMHELPYVQLDPHDAERVLLATGASTAAVRLMSEMNAALNEGRIAPLEPRSAETTTPTTLGQFAKLFAVRFLGGATGLTGRFERPRGG